MKIKFLSLFLSWLSLDLACALYLSGSTVAFAASNTSNYARSPSSEDGCNKYMSPEKNEKFLTEVSDIKGLKQKVHSIRHENNGGYEFFVDYKEKKINGVETISYVNTTIDDFAPRASFFAQLDNKWYEILLEARHVNEFLFNVLPGHKDGSILIIATRFSDGGAVSHLVYKLERLDNGKISAPEKVEDPFGI